MGVDVNDAIRVRTAPSEEGQRCQPIFVLHGAHHPDDHHHHYGNNSLLPQAESHISENWHFATSSIFWSGGKNLHDMTCYFTVE